MVLYHAVTFLLIFHVVKSYVIEYKVTCEDVYRDMNNRKIIDIGEYCNNKICVNKCCGADELLNQYGQCLKANYREDGSYWWNNAKFKNITFIQNDWFIGSNSGCFNTHYFGPPSNIDYDIMEDGTMTPYLKNSSPTQNNVDELRKLHDIPKLTFCFEIEYDSEKKVKAVCREKTVGSVISNDKNKFLNVLFNFKLNGNI